MDKIRLDMYLVKNGYYGSRQKAQSGILAGEVYINGVVTHKASSAIDHGDSIEVRRLSDTFSSRGGYKLEKAFEVFSLDVNGLCGMDIGASTGGFTDCLLNTAHAKYML